MKEEDVVRLCKLFDKKAQKLFFDAHAPFVRGICFRYAKDMAIAEDLLQETFISAFSNIGSFQWAGEGCSKGWIKRIAVNKAINFIQRDKAWNLRAKDIDTMDFPDTDSLDEAEAEELSHTKACFEAASQADIPYSQILGTVDQLPDKLQVVFKLYAIEGLRHQEIAELLSINIEASRIRLMRARKQLRTLIAVLLQTRQTVSVC